MQLVDYNYIKQSESESNKYGLTIHTEMSVHTKLGGLEIPKLSLGLIWSLMLVYNTI